jgi:hypothetical protein
VRGRRGAVGGYSRGTVGYSRGTRGGAECLRRERRGHRPIACSSAPAPPPHVEHALGVLKGLLKGVRHRLVRPEGPAERRRRAEVQRHGRSL